VSPTRAGQALRDQVRKAWCDLEQVTAAGFTETEYQQAMQVLARIEANLTTPPPIAGAADTTA
jgi:DNA-binding MarR family transcriptional regulator